MYPAAISVRISGFRGQEIRRIARRDRFDCPLQRVPVARPDLKPLRGLVTNNMGEADRDAEGDLHRV